MIEKHYKQRELQLKTIEVNGCRQSLALIIMDGDLIGADVSVEKSLKQRKNTGGITRINTFYFQKKSGGGKSNAIIWIRYELLDGLHIHITSTHLLFIGIYN